MHNPFEYHAPSQEQIEIMTIISDKLADVYDYVMARVPSSGERVIAIRKLQEARMWVNASLVLNPSDE